MSDLNKLESKMLKATAAYREAVKVAFPPGTKVEVKQSVSSFTGIVESVMHSGLVVVATGNGASLWSHGHLTAPTDSTQVAGD